MEELNYTDKIAMIDKYLSEHNSIEPKLTEILEVCKDLLIEKINEQEVIKLTQDFLDKTINQGIFVSPTKRRRRR